MMKKIIDRLEVEYSIKGENILKATIREAGSLEWSPLKQIWRNLRNEHIDYPAIWFEIVVELKKKFEDSETIVELYPSETANIRGLIEDEIKLLEDENYDSDIYSKSLLESGSIYQFIFNIESNSHLKKIIGIYYSDYCMNIYLIPSSEKYKFANLLSEHKTSFSERYLIKNYKEPYCFLTTHIDMHIITNRLTIQNVCEAISFKKK